MFMFQHTTQIIHYHFPPTTQLISLIYTSLHISCNIHPHTKIIKLIDTQVNSMSMSMSMSMSLSMSMSMSTSEIKIYSIDTTKSYKVTIFPGPRNSTIFKNTINPFYVHEKTLDTNTNQHKS